MSLALTPGLALGLVQEKKSTMTESLEEFPLSTIDTGVFINELSYIDLLPKKFTDFTSHDHKALKQNPEKLLAKAQRQAPDSIKEGTYRGTQFGIKKLYELIESQYTSFMATCNFESAMPSPLTLDQKRTFFAFTDGSDEYPPHLNLAANKPAAELEQGKGNVQKSTLSPAELFNSMRLAQLATLLPSVVPKTFKEKVYAIGFDVAGKVANFHFGGWAGMGTPDRGTKLEDVENYQRERHESRKADIFDLPNLGLLRDWYIDARFAQQHFTGTNPVTIELASDRWVNHFVDAAEDALDQTMKKLIMALAHGSRRSLYMQDYSYFREAAGLKPSDIIQCKFEESYHERKEDSKKPEVKPRDGFRYGCASVCLFYLDEAGKLLPLAIVIDWRGARKDSVTIYNRELLKRDTELAKLVPGIEKGFQDTRRVDEAHDWAWRYAKTCVQSSDWVRHEMTVHLTHTHLIEEAVIVGATRTLPDWHPVLKLLYPHWQKTLSLNAAARDTLVPSVIIKLIGFEDTQASRFIRHAYETFDFQGSYVPSDLRRRGFPPEQLNDTKFHNYAYARCIYSMWWKIRSYIAAMLSLSYSGPNADLQVKEDHHIRDWCAEMQAPLGAGANIKTFPTVTSLEALIDCVTMCIHIASPQHTAVNYLQNYYQAFVPNKPACLYHPPPTSLQQLLGYTEHDLVKALPMNHPREWLLASHIPYLLSFKPGDKESLIIYAASVAHVNYTKMDESDEAKRKAEAAAEFWYALKQSKEEFARYGAETDDADVITYEVLAPEWNAVSILI